MDKIFTVIPLVWRVEPDHEIVVEEKYTPYPLVQILWVIDHLSWLISGIQVLLNFEGDKKTAIHPVSMEVGVVFVLRTFIIQNG